MNKLLKFFGNTFIGIASVILFFIALSHKVFWFPFLLGLLGVLLLILLAFEVTSFKKEWKIVTVTGITSILFIFGAGYLFCVNYNSPDWLLNICYFGGLITLVLEIVVICTIIILSIFKK